MIDMHIHAVNPRLPGVLALPALLDGSPEALAAILRQQMQASSTEGLLGMGHLDGSAEDPLGIASTLRIAEFLPTLHPIGVADPSRTTRRTSSVSNGSCNPGR